MKECVGLVVQSDELLHPFFVLAVSHQMARNRAAQDNDIPVPRDIVTEYIQPTELGLEVSEVGGIHLRQSVSASEEELSVEHMEAGDLGRLTRSSVLLGRKEAYFHPGFFITLEVELVWPAMKGVGSSVSPKLRVVNSDSKIFHSHNVKHRTIG